MSSIIDFLSGELGKLSKLEDIDPRLAGQSVAKLIDENSDLHHFYTRVENLTLPITVLRCDYSKKSHMDYLFTIFHRLNTGGMKLNNQEIRNCIYSGSLNDLLKELDQYQRWRKINKMRPGVSYRFTKQELILRFFAFHDSYKKYSGRLARFLNEYMRENKDIGSTALETKKKLFKQTVDIIYRKVFRGRTPPKISIALLEGLLVGVSFNLRFLEAQSVSSVRTLYTRLQRHEEFSEKKLSEGLSGKPRVMFLNEPLVRVLFGLFEHTSSSNKQ